MDEYFRELPATDEPASLLYKPEILSLVACSGDNEQQLQQEWNKLLLDQARDFIHVLSLKGFFLYCSRSCSRVLEHDPEELIGHSLSSICHPSDIVPVMREIKEAASHPDKVISLVFRIRRKYSGYMWIECQGKLHVDHSKGRKCLILAGRERPVYRLPLKDVANANKAAGGYAGTEFWAKLSLEGLYLRVSKLSQDVINYDADELDHTSLYRYAGDDDIPSISRALASVRLGEIVHLNHTMRNSRGQYVDVISTFYPGDVAHGIGRPSFAIVQTRLASTVDASVSISAQADDNMFAEVETVRGTSWQYELHQLQMANQRLREQIEELEGKDKKKRKTSKKTPPSESPLEVKMCAQCQCTDSPEWRKGPNGPKELCNACGLRYAKLQKDAPPGSVTATT